jgi:hypothetical protein
VDTDEKKRVVAEEGQNVTGREIGPTQRVLFAMFMPVFLDEVASVSVPSLSFFLLYSIH